MKILSSPDVCCFSSEFSVLKGVVQQQLTLAYGLFATSISFTLN